MDALQTMSQLHHDAAYYAMWATWWSVIAIAFTGAIAIFGIYGGNREKRRDRAIALMGTIKSQQYRDLMSHLQPFGDVEKNRAFHHDSYHGTRTLSYPTGPVVISGLIQAPIVPLSPGDYLQHLIEATNLFEEMYLHIKWKLVDDRVLLDAFSLIILSFYYVVQPLLSHIETTTHMSFQNFRDLAKLSQIYVRRNNREVEQKFLDVPTS